MKPCVLTIVRSSNGAILLVKRADVPIWVIPGGGIEKGEDPEEAGRRELLEETGLLAQKLRLRGHLTPNGVFTAETYIFEVTGVEGTLQLTEETSGYGFFALEKLPKALFPIHRSWIKRVLSSEAIVEGPIKELTWRVIMTYVLLHPLTTVRWLWTVATKNLRELK